MSRKRKLENRDLPPFLYLRKGIYFYRDHRNGKEYSLGKNKTLAISQAIQANIEILNPKINLLDRINNVKVITLHDWLDDYFNIINKRGLKPKSISDYLSQINIIKNKFKDTSLDEITPHQIQSFIDDYGKPTMAKLLRSLLSDSFNEAVRFGVVEKNPVLSTKPPKIIIARKRLTLEEFNVVINSSNKKYKNIFLLSLLIGQRIGDIAKLKWSDIKDGKIYVVQSKTGSRIAIPTNLRLECIGYSIDDILINLKNNSEFICGVGSGAIRDNFSKYLPKSENKPTFHEIRSLSARLWESEKGTEFSSKLLGHKSLVMTKKYLDKRDDSFVIL